MIRELYKYIGDDAILCKCNEKIDDVKFKHICDNCKGKIHYMCPMSLRGNPMVGFEDLFEKYYKLTCDLNLTEEEYFLLHTFLTDMVVNSGVEVFEKLYSNLFGDNNE